jgi:glutathione peroxidase
MSIYTFGIKDAQGKDSTLEQYRGKVLLIVNTASQCGLTPQYAGLEQVYEAWHDRGLEILAFPCNQFGLQEPGSNEEIQQFCQINYGVTFPVFAKLEVNGPGAHPLYQYLTSVREGPNGCEVQWNFTKFLVDADGNVVERFEPVVKPEEIVPAIERLIG